jgi:hypothetical protein
VEYEAYHLREIGKGRFTAVILPVGVGRETDSGVESEVRADRSEPLRVQRKEMLETEDGISEQQSDQAEEDRSREGDKPVVRPVSMPDPGRFLLPR